MKKQQKQMLKTVFAAPKPKQKEQFIMQIEGQTQDIFERKNNRQRMAEFLLTQVGYVSKWVWIVSFAAFLTAVFTGIFVPDNMLWMMSAVMPILAAAGVLDGYVSKWVWIVSFAAFLTAVFTGIFVPDNMLWMMSAVMPILAAAGVLETVRSDIHKMAELEQASRYSLRSILFARLEIVGMVHFLLFSMGVFLVHTAESSVFLYSAVYLFVPYLLTSGGCLFLVRRLHGREGAYGAAAFAVLIAFLPQILSYWRELLYGAENFKWWLALLFLLLVFNALQYRKTINNSEDLSWNLK